MANSEESPVVAIFERFKKQLAQLKYYTFRPKQQQAFLEDMAGLIDDGVPAKKAIEIIAKTATEVTQEVAEYLILTIAAGQYLSDGMVGWFPSIVVELVRAGEEGGTLPQTLRIASETLTKKNNAIATLLSSLTYPLVVLAAGMMVAVFLNHSIFDNFREIMPMDQWPAVGRDVAQFASVIQAWWWLLVVLIVAMVFGTMAMLRHYVGEGRQTIDSILPFSLYRKSMSARFMQLLGLLISNGVVLKKALKMLQHHANPYLGWHLLNMEYRLGRGTENIAEVLDTGLIDKSDMIRLKIVAHGRGFEHALIRQGERALQQSEISINRVARLTGSVLLVCGALLAIFMIFGVYNVGSAIGR